MECDKQPVKMAAILLGFVQSYGIEFDVMRQTRPRNSILIAFRRNQSIRLNVTIGLFVCYRQEIQSRMSLSDESP